MSKGSLYLSFPFEGYTLTLDFPVNDALFPKLNKLDELVLKYEGRIYLAKDARMPEEVFKASYPQWKDFLELKKQVDPNNKFRSLQSERIGLTY